MELHTEGVTFVRVVSGRAHSSSSSVPTASVQLVADPLGGEARASRPPIPLPFALYKLHTRRAGSRGYKLSFFTTIIAPAGTLE